MRKDYSLKYQNNNNMTTYEKEMNTYGFEKEDKFVSIMPEIIEKIGAIGEIQHSNEVNISPFDPTGKSNVSNLVVPDFVGVLDEE